MNWLRVIAWGVGVTAAALGSLLAPALATLILPKFVQRHPIEWCAAAVLVGRLAAGSWGRRRGDDGVIRAVDQADELAGWMLRRGLFPALAAWTIFRLAGWLPHYPYWPWNRDFDAFAETARLWDRGVLPYRDIRSYNFPGHVYIHWALGKLFGWGRPGLYYVADAAALLALGGVTLSWSRRRLGGPLPGMASYFIFLAAYFDMPIEHVAERDWHATLGAVLALMILQARPGRAGRWLAAVPAAAAFATRPHLVLFFPALLAAAWSGAGDDAAEPEPIRRRAARAVEWVGAFGIFAALAFLPLAAAGILDDLFRNLQTAAYGGPYSTFTPDRALTILLEEARQPTTIALAVALMAMSVCGPFRALARAWLLALAGAMAYRPLHPVDHAYLLTVLKLVEAMGWAVPIAWCVRACSAEAASGRAKFAGMLAILMLLYETVPSREPYNCSLAASLGAVRAAARGGWPDVPPGAYGWFHPQRFPTYPWDDYNRLLRHVRETSGPDAVVANLLKSPPLPPVNGPTGRPSPFRAESGIAWMWLVRQDLDEEFARQLEAAGADSLVVWAPDEIDAQPRLPLPLTMAVVLREYEPEARFGPMEVRRRRKGP